MAVQAILHRHTLFTFDAISHHGAKPPFRSRRSIIGCCQAPAVAADKSQTKPPFRSLPSIIGCMTPPKVQSDIKLFLDIVTATPSVIFRAIGRSARPSSAHGCSGHFASTHSVHVRCHLPSRGQATLPFTSIYHRLHDTPQGTVRYQLVPGHFHCDAICHLPCHWPECQAVVRPWLFRPFCISTLCSLRCHLSSMGRGCQAPAVAHRSQTNPPFFCSLRSIFRAIGRRPVPTRDDGRRGLPGPSSCPSS